MKTLSGITALLMVIFFTSCKKDDKPTTTNASGTLMEGIRFSAVEVGSDNCFSTFDTSFRSQTWAYFHLTAAQLKNVDLLYIHDYEYDEPGFMDPVTASKEWYWNNKIYYYPELTTTSKTILYVTTLTKSEFDLIKDHKANFDQYFNNPSVVKIAPHSIFPEGSCIGGRSGSPKFKIGQVFGFKSVASGKRGLIYLRADQDNGWPDFAVTRFSTIVDIVKEK